MEAMPSKEEADLGDPPTNQKSRIRDDRLALPRRRLQSVILHNVCPITKIVFNPHSAGSSVIKVSGYID